MAAALKLISHKLCPYVQRAVIALTEKGVPFERIDIDLANKPDWFLKISPLGKVPVLLVETADGEAALFESGRPVLIAPASAPQVIGENVLVAWNGSTEQTRTTAFAMPMLREARQVTVLSVEGGMTPGPTGEEVAHHLRMNAVAATAVTAAPGTRTTGEAILDHAKTHGCDLLVKGAYTQSRLRQMVFGGATRHILASATLPVLMAH